jgi:hypothetical protein
VKLELEEGLFEDTNPLGHDGCGPSCGSAASAGIRCHDAAMPLPFNLSIQQYSTAAIEFGSLEAESWELVCKRLPVLGPVIIVKRHSVTVGQ